MRCHGLDIKDVIDVHILLYTVRFLNQCEFVVTLIGWLFFEQSIAAAQCAEGVGAKYRKFLEINKICPEVGIYKRKQENKLSTRKDIKK